MCLHEIVHHHSYCAFDIFGPFLLSALQEEVNLQTITKQCCWLKDTILSAAGIDPGAGFSVLSNAFPQHSSAVL